MRYFRFLKVMLFSVTKMKTSRTNCPISTHLAVKITLACNACLCFFKICKIITFSYLWISLGVEWLDGFLEELIPPSSLRFSWYKTIKQIAQFPGLLRAKNLWNFAEFLLLSHVATLLASDWFWIRERFIKEDHFCLIMYTWQYCVRTSEIK